MSSWQRRAALFRSLIPQWLGTKFGLSHFSCASDRRSEAATAMTRALPVITSGVHVPEHVEKIFSWPALTPVIVRIFGDALTGQNKRAVIAEAIQHDSLPFGQPCDAVLWNLLGDDEVWGTSRRLCQPGDAAFGGARQFSKAAALCIDTLTTFSRSTHRGILCGRKS